jgi:RNA polymerase sigma-70 factor (ECF subfamily)
MGGFVNRGPPEIHFAPAINYRHRAFTIAVMGSSERETNETDRFNEWVREHGRAVRGYVLGMVRRVDQAEDLAQEVFCRAWQSRARYREQGNARAYLLRIADHLVCDRGRRAGRETTVDQETWKAIEPAGRTEEPPQTAIRSEALDQLAVALDRLSPIQRRVLLLRYYGQVSFAEIAEMVGCPLNTTLSHCRRGLETMRKLLVEEMP